MPDRLAYIPESQRVLEILKPETDLEKKILTDSRVVKNLFWGKPRNGHPEGKIIDHLVNLNRNIEILFKDKKINPTERQWLRIISLTHDTFKSEQVRGKIHHSTIAADYLRFLGQEIPSQVITITKLHDTAFGNMNRGQNIDQRILDLKGRNIPGCRNGLILYYMFTVCDGSTNGKDQKFITWLTNQLTNKL